MRTAHLVRRNWRATMFLALLAGIAGGIVMGAWSAGRRTTTAFDRLLAYSDLSDLIVTICPPEVTELAPDALNACLSYDPVEEEATIRELPEVESSGRGAFRALTAAPTETPDRTRMASSFVSGDPSTPSVAGRPLVLEGHMYAPHAPEEVVVNESFRDRFDAGVGAELSLTFQGAEELGVTVGEGERFDGPTAEVRVVGVVRTVRDIAARTGAESFALDESIMYGGPGLWEATPGASGYGGIAVWPRDGDTQAARAAIERAFPDRVFNIAPTNGPDEIEPIREAISYEARGVLAFAALAGLAVAVFGGQAVARQSRREWADLPALRALGLSNRQARAAAGIRGLVTGGAGAMIAVATAIGLSGVGTLGVARAGEVDPGLHPDPLVLIAGGGLVLVLVTLAAVFPVGRTTRARSRRRRELVVSPPPLRPAISAGIGMAFNGGRGGNGLPMGAALASVTLAAVALVAATTLTASLTRLTETPASFGAPWDVSFLAGDLGNAESALRGRPEVEAAAGIFGTDVVVNGDVMWAHALLPVPGVDEVIRPVITDGRMPVTVGEIALGAISMRNLGVAAGDTVEMRSSTSESGLGEMTVVGTALINDSFEGSAGIGAVVAEWPDEFAAEVTPDPFVVRLRPGSDREAFLAHLEEVSPGQVNGPVRQMAIRNVERIRYLPFLLVALVALLAVASLSHALALSVRRHRSQLAVCKTLGFTRGQVAAAVATHASVLVVAAVAIGIPLGAVAGRWGWRVVADQLGIAAGPVVPLLAVAAVAAGAIVAAILVAALPAGKAARLNTAQALRVE